MKVRIKQEHIDNGQPCRASLCPIALALRDRGYREPVVGPYLASVETKRGLVKYTMSKDATQFIKNFDGGVKVEPMTVELIKRKNIKHA